MKSGYHFCHTLRVRFAETDLQGVVFNANFLMYYDVAWTEYLRAIGLTYDEMIGIGVDTLLARTEVEFLAPARFDDVLDIYACATGIRNTSVTVKFEVYNRQSDVLIGSASSLYVCVDPRNHRPIQIPTDLHDRLRQSEQKSLSESGNTLPLAGQ